MLARALLCLCLAFPVFAIDLPFLSGPLVDEVGLVNEDERSAIETALQTLWSSKRAQMAIFIAKDLRETTIEDLSIAVADKWVLGEKGKDQGLILLIAPNDRKMRLEVGRGLEGDIPDIIANRILTQTIAPYFRENRFGDGLLLAIEEVAKRLDVDLKAPVSDRLQTERKNVSPLILLFLLFGILGLVVMSSLSGISPRRRGFGGWSSHSGWGGGGGSGFGGGGGGFSAGGGGFSGGGSSSSW